MKNFISLNNLELKSSFSIKSFISATSEVNSCPITNVLQEDKNIWISEEFLPQEITINFNNIKLKEHPKKLTAIGIYCWNKYPTNPKIIEVLISKGKEGNFISLGHFDLNFKSGRQLIYLNDENDMELEKILNNVNFNNLIIKLVIKETFGGKHTYINSLYLYDNIGTSNINSNNNINIDNDIKDELNNIINDEYKYLDEDNNNSNDNINDNKDKINDINDSKTKGENLNKIDINKETNQNQKILIFNKNNENEINNLDNINNNISQNFEDDNISENKYKTVTSKNNNKKIIPNKNRLIKTPKIFKKYSYGEERTITNNSFKYKNINTTVRQYKKKNFLDYSNNSNYLTNLNVKSSNALTQLINEFKNYKENQELMMNNYETRVQLLEEKCIELKNSMKKMNATMNTIIESQYKQNQETNDYFLKECQNMVNETIVNVISNMGRNSGYTQQPMYAYSPLTMKINKKMNNNMYINSYNNRIPYGININNNYEQNYLNKNNNINIMNNNFYEDDNFENIIYDNDNNNIDNENDNGEEYMTEEIQNNVEDENYNNTNNDFNNNYDIENNDENENNIDYYKNENEKLNINDDEHINNNDNILDNDDLNINLNINNLKEKNNNSHTTRSINPNELSNDDYISFDEKIKSIPNNFSNHFAHSTINYHTNIKNQNNTSKIKNKSKSNKNIEIIMKKDNQNFVDETNNHVIKKALTNNNSKKSVKNNNNEDETNQELSSDFSSIDEIQINSKITENILKPTLEKFENLISINNNFGKSQNVYSSNSIKSKEKYFEKSSNNKK